MSPVSQHIPQYSTGGSRSILLEEMKSQREIVFAVRESRICGREISAKIPNLANQLSMKGRKRKTDLGEMYQKSCVGIILRPTHSRLWTKGSINSPLPAIPSFTLRTTEPFDRALKFSFTICTQNTKGFLITIFSTVGKFIRQKL